jgi:hypothetical protein
LNFPQAANFLAGGRPTGTSKFAFQLLDSRFGAVPNGSAMLEVTQFRLLYKLSDRGDRSFAVALRS